MNGWHNSGRMGESTDMNPGVTRDALAMAAIASWVAIGGGIGLVAATASSVAFPAGRLGAALAGAAGAFLGGGFFTLIADRHLSHVDPLSLVIAATMAVIVLAAVRSAQFAEPRPQ